MANSSKCKPVHETTVENIYTLIGCLDSDDKQALLRIIRLLIISKGNTPLSTVFVVYEGNQRIYKGNSIGTALPLFNDLLALYMDTLRNGLEVDIAFYGIEPCGRVLVLWGRSHEFTI